MSTAASFEVPNDLWRVPVYLPYLQPPLTDAAVADAEARLGVRLPASFIATLRIQNGGYLRRSAHPSDHAPVDTIAGIGPRFPSLLERDWADVKEYMQEAGYTTPERIDELVPFCGDGHYFYCLDYRRIRESGEPCVTYVDVESFNVDEAVANDFAEFLSQLRREGPSPVYGLVTRDDAERVAATVSATTGLSFVDSGDQANGYRVFRAKLPADAGWVWLAANRARRGFVRTSDKEYPTLSLLLPELVDRYPEEADCGYFLSCSDLETDPGRALVASLDRLPFAVRALRLDDG